MSKSDSIKVKDEHIKKSRESLKEETNPTQRSNIPDTIEDIKEEQEEFEKDESPEHEMELKMKDELDEEVN